MQYVAIDNVSSTISNIDCGVPKGNVLGPLLFLNYMDDIQHCSRDCNLYLFADNINVLLVVKQYLMLPIKQIIVCVT